MNDSGHPHDLIDGLNAIGYDPNLFDEIKEAPVINHEFFLGSGSIISTVRDLQIWINSLNTFQLLSSESTRKLLNNYGNNYGLGISVYSFLGEEVFGHDGRITGFIADYLFYKERELSIVILGNIQTGVADFLRRDIASIILGKEYSSKAKTGIPKNISDEVKHELVGTYQFGPDFNVFLEIIDDLPMVKANQGAFSELIPMKDGSYFNRMLYSSVRFNRNSEGKISTMDWINNDGTSFPGKKIN